MKTGMLVSLGLYCLNLNNQVSYLKLSLKCCFPVSIFFYICLSISRIPQRIARPGSYKERGSSLLPIYAEVFCPFAVPSLQQNIFIRV